jgi:hypothetical protein
VQGVSSPKRKAKLSVNQQIKAGLSAMKDFLAGRSNDDKVVVPEDKETREVVAAELLAAMSGRGSGEVAPENPETSKNSTSDTQEIPRFESEREATQHAGALNDSQQLAASNSAAANSVASDQEQERARQLFLDHGYFDETVQNLRAANSPSERAAAARALGVVGSHRATAHLIAAMFDDDEDVRNAAAEALVKIGEPAGDKPAAATASAKGTRTAAEISSATPSVSEKVAPPPRAIEAVPTAVEAAPLAVEVVPPAVETKAASVEPTAVLPEVVTVETEAPANAQLESPTSPAAPDPDRASDLMTATPATADENQLLREQQTILETVAGLEQQQLAAATSFKELENEVRWRTEREAKLRADAMARRLEEEEARKRVEEEAEIRRTKERESVEIERAARLKAEVEAQRYRDEETKLLEKAATLRLEAADLARRRADLETARQQAAEAERLAEAMRVREDARSRHETELATLASEKKNLQTATEEVLQQQAKLRTAREQAAGEIEKLKEEQKAAEAAQRADAERLRQEAQQANSEAAEQLRSDLENLRLAGEEVARRRHDVEAAREKADEEAQRLVAAQARMQAAEQARAQAEAERSQLEAEINQHVQAQLKQLEETRGRGEDEKARLEQELRLRAEKEQQRLAELEAIKARAEAESKELAEREGQILAQIDRLRIADADTRRRIEDADVRRRAADDAYRLIAVKVQRVEAEAHARAKEEERMLAKLEAERRNAAIEAQSRSDQEKRIREEIEMFRRLEEEERPRIEEATLQLADAEARLQDRKERLKEDADARMAAEEELLTARGEVENNVSERPAPAAAAENIRPVAKSWDAEALGGNVDESLSSHEAAPPAVTPAIATYLNSVDPYKRAAAVAELARAGSPDAFSRIVACFDDHSPHVRNAAARALRTLEPDRTVDLFNRALEEATADRRRNIGAAIAASGLAAEAINNLASESREDTYNALSILFVMAKTGEVEPLLRAEAEHGDDEIGKAVSKLLTLSGHR